MVYRGMVTIGPLPNFATVFWQIFITHIGNSFLFYATHRALHHPSLYSFHKQHHEFHASTGFAAEYASPIEYIFSNMLPTFLFVIYGGYHCYILVVWTGFRLALAYITHSGYAIPLLLPTAVKFHDAHHSRNHGNYSATPLWDLLFDTCDAKWIDEMNLIDGGY